MEGLTRRTGSNTRPPSAAAQRPRTPGVTYTVLTLGFAVFVGAIALTSRQAPPPTIAEFAPQAVEQISDPSGDLTGTAGGTSGATPPIDEAADAASRTRQSIDVARARHCVGDPPRQIEDPQSPPCVPYWSGDNGGATWRGVTRDEIRVSEVLYDAGWSPALEAFFNSRFEFYGRRIRLIPHATAGDNPAAKRASARAAYEQDQAFASTSVCDHCHAYLDELARLGIVGVTYVPIFPETYLAAHRPYLWTYPMANDRLFSLAGNWYCARFAGRNAVHAGDPLLQASRRKAGIVLTQADWEGTTPDPMNSQLASCGARTDAVVHSTVQSNDYAHFATFMENAMLQMKTSGVTTVTCLCEVEFAGIAMRAATNQGYLPEWLLTTYVTNEAMWAVRLLTPPDQLKTTMFLLTYPMQRPSAEHPSNWAVQHAGNAGYPAASKDPWWADIKYQMLLLLASGFQLAGPHLTPETFERGLQRAKFPNPQHRIMAGAVGFGEGGGWAEPDHSMTDDAAEIWWSNTAPSPYAEDGVGTFCYVDHGARRRMGGFPTDDPFFQGPCDNGTS